MADDVERRLSHGASLPLAGVPYALKDLTETAGLRTTYGSKLREHFVPAHDAAVARRLREAGGVLIGKTNTPEFGNRATTAFGLFPATRNPWDPTQDGGRIERRIGRRRRRVPLSGGGRFGWRRLHSHPLELLRGRRPQAVSRTRLERPELESARRAHHPRADHANRA